MVENVEEVAFKFERSPLADFEALSETEIRVEESRSKQRVSLHLPVVAPCPAVSSAGYSGFKVRRRASSAIPT